MNKAQKKGRVSLATAALFHALLLLPALAALRLPRSFDLRLVAGYASLIPAVAWLLYRHDKGRALIGGRRTPESTLHLVELLGGWPGAFLAQRLLRHKISKTAYQVKFWMIIALHQSAAFDFIQGWRYSKKVLSLL